MSDDSNLWDDDGVNWQEISSQVIDEASNPSTVATAAEESSTRHLVEGPVETVESVFPRERTVDASLQPSLNQRISNQTAPEWRTTPTSGSSRRHLGSTTQDSGRVQQRGVVKRTILALLEGSSPENDNRKNAKNKRRRNEGELGVGTKTNQETPPSSPTVTSSQAARIRGALDSYDDELSCPILAPQLLNPCGHSVCGDCITHWVDRSKGKPTCPTCRAELSSASPYLYNLAINNTVEKHIEMLRNNKDEGWKENGVKWKERQVRKRTYEAIKSSKPDPPKRQISPWFE
ncbi:hypothetical protein FRC16_008715 [Serendipita sp. 398]|nr:hypothetical protein FRC16_008715 [Serendipita sp. 398]